MDNENASSQEENQELIVPMEQLDSFEFESDDDEDGFFFEFEPGEE